MSSSTLNPQSWQQDYAAEYQRTTGQTASFSPIEKGGWTTLETTHDDGVAHRTRVRKSSVLAMTARLRERPRHCAGSGAA